MGLDMYLYVESDPHPEEVCYWRKSPIIHQVIWEMVGTTVNKEGKTDYSSCSAEMTYDQVRTLFNYCLDRLCRDDVKDGSYWEFQQTAEKLGTILAHYPNMKFRYSANW